MEKEGLDLIYNEGYGDLYYSGKCFRDEDLSLGKVFSCVSNGVSSVLDVGCSNGIMIDIFGFKKEQYTGLDINKQFIKNAINKYKGYKFILGNIEKAKGNYDYSIGMYGVMNYLTNDEIDLVIAKSKKGFIFMDYKNGYHPFCYPTNDFPQRKFEPEKYQKYYKGEFNNYNIYSNLDFNLITKNLGNKK